MLERIRAEKERLIAEGKIKRSKKSATSDTSHYENVPFEVPEGWTKCCLYDIVSADCTLGYGIVQPMDDINDGVPVVRPVDLTTQIIRNQTWGKDWVMSRTYKHQATYDYLHHNKEVKGKLLKGIKKFFMNVNFPRWDFSRRSWYKHKTRYDNERIDRSSRRIIQAD